ncbi:MAG: DUF1801 domain-containing protein [Geodermatophilaceae bacterium]|nr:DUF1801 domain-containing protein [Geodermatophilaceae bacterium]
MSIPEFDAALAAASDEVHDLALRARALVLDVLPADVLETIDGTDIGYGWTRGYKGTICVSSVYARWINLGLPNGVDLPDPAGLLQGTGKKHRHVRIASLADLDSQQSAAFWKPPVRPTPGPPPRTELIIGKTRVFSAENRRFADDQLWVARRPFTDS